MRYYELTIITKNSSDPAGIISSLPIQPAKEQQGPNFITLEFYAEPEKIQELEKKLKAENVRYMILIKEPHKEVKIRRKAPAKEPLSIKTSEQKPAVHTQEKKVDLNALDKKLKEILEE